MDDATRLRRLEPPTGDVPVVLDTDAYNEVDDQFAVAHALSSDAVSVEAAYAAPFDNDRSTGPGDGMERSYQELLELRDLLGTDCPVLRGADRHLEGPADAVESAATTDLVERARDHDRLYVVAIGAATNVASALALAPEVADSVVVVWLGGQPHDWPTAEEFNLSGDPHAARRLLDGVPLVHVPCANVAEHLRTTLPELESLLGDRGDVGAALLDRVRAYGGDRVAWSKPIWDLAATAWVVDPSLVATAAVPAPVLTGDLTWNRDPDRHLVRVARRVDRDAVFRSLLSTLD